MISGQDHPSIPTQIWRYCLGLLHESTVDTTREDFRGTETPNVLISGPSGPARAWTSPCSRRTRWFPSVFGFQNGYLDQQRTQTVLSRSKLSFKHRRFRTPGVWPPANHNVPKLSSNVFLNLQYACSALPSRKTTDNFILKWSSVQTTH